MYDNLKIKKSIIITGGNKGIGLEIAKSFLNQNYTVIVGGRSQIKLKDKNLFFVKCDLTKYSSHEKLIKVARKNSSNLIAYINNIGISEWRRIERVDNKFLNKMISTNLISFFWGCKVAKKYIKNGSIINISSIAGKRGSKNNSVYSATKFAVNGMTQSLAKELGPQNLRVNAICPVLIKTPGLIKALKRKDSPGYPNTNLFLKKFKKDNVALKNLPQAKDVGDLCVFLVEKNSNSITGQCINLDSGVFPQ